MTYTHSYVLMEVSTSTYNEIRAKLLAAGYDHAIIREDSALDMHGIALVEKPKEAPNPTIKGKQAGETNQGTIHHYPDDFLDEKGDLS